MNKKVTILSLSVSNNYLIINFKLNAFEAIITFNEILFKIEMKLKRLSIFFSIVIFFLTFFS